MSGADTPKLFRLSAYMAPGDAFHLARKPLAAEGEAPLHRHDYFELFVVEQGRCRHVVNGEAGELAPGALVFIRPNDVHAVCSVGRGACRITNVMIRPETADHLLSRYGDDLADQFFWARGAAPVTLSLVSDRLEAMLGLVQGLQTGPRGLARIEAFLLQVMTDVADPVTRAAPAMPAWLAEACDAARRPEVCRRGASGLVEAAGRGHEHVCRQMKRHLGLTPSVYVNRIRMERAGHLLSQGGLTLADIAAEIGLENMSHFHRLFRAHHGLTPRAFRARNTAAPF